MGLGTFLAIDVATALNLVSAVAVVAVLVVVAAHPYLSRRRRANSLPNQGSPLTVGTA